MSDKNDTNSFDIYMRIEGLDEIREKTKQIDQLVDEIEKIAESLKRSSVFMQFKTGTGDEHRVHCL